MAHFAFVDNGIVEKVVVASQEFIDTGKLGDKDKFVQTSYNTRGGVHYGQDEQPDEGTPLRKNYAGVGYSYDSVRGAFIPPKPYESWSLNEDTCLWEAPTPKPEGNYEWDEENLEWVLIS